MPEIKINGKSHEYTDAKVINLVEGLIGLPRLKNAVLVECESFLSFSLAGVD